MAHVEDYAHERNSVAMILITPDEGSSDLDQHLTSIQRQLALIKRDLEILHEQILAGEIGLETQANKTMGSIKHWTRLAMETEMKIAEQKRLMSRENDVSAEVLTSPMLEVHVAQVSALFGPGPFARLMLVK